MQNLPALPDNIEPLAKHVEFRAMQCMNCGEMGPPVDTSDKDNTDHLWDPEHARTTGHHDFYAWTLTRNIAWSGTVGQLRKGRK